jgi:hypothetical protein
MLGPRALALLALPLLATSGCISVFVDAVVDPMGRKAALHNSQREYTKLVRWGDIEGAARYVHPEAREKFLSLAPAFAGIRVSDFDMGEISFGPGEASASARVTYRAYSLSTFIEKEIRETQQWERLGRGNEWVVRPELQGIVDQVAGTGGLP